MRKKGTNRRSLFVPKWMVDRLVASDLRKSRGDREETIDAAVTAIPVVEAGPSAERGNERPGDYGQGEQQDAQLSQVESETESEAN